MMILADEEQSNSGILFKRILAAVFAQEYRLRNREANQRYRKKYGPVFKEADRLRASKWRAENREKFLKNCRSWRAKNKAKIKEYSARDYLKRRVAILEKGRQWSAKNPDRVRAYRKASSSRPHVKANRKIYVKKYIEKNKAKLLAKQLEYQKKRTATDPVFSMIRSFRTRLWRLIARSERKSTWALLGCSNQELKRHLESLFLTGMTWGNRGFGEGRWVVDHKIPVASFDMSNPVDQATCWNFKNLQPMWWHDNIIKGSKVVA